MSYLLFKVKEKQNLCVLLLLLYILSLEMFLVLFFSLLVIYPHV